MQIYHPTQLKQIATEIKKGKVVVLPTDTIYGVCASALNQKAVERVYELRERDKDKPCIILIAKVEELKKFGLQPDSQLKDLLNSIWPNRISVVLPCASRKIEYLHRGTKTLSFRIPNSKFLLRLLKLTGPIIAPSANIQGRQPSKTIKAAQKYFKTQVLYVDGGVNKGKPSSLIHFDDNFDLKILRAGATSGSKYYFMRHGEAIGNVQNRLSSYPENFYNPLTTKGKAQIAAKLKGIKRLGIDFIIASPLLRTKQTVKIISQALKIPAWFDSRLREIDFGVLNGQPTFTYQNLFQNTHEKYLKAPRGGENRRQVKLRMLQALFELEKKYQEKNILIISHQDPIWVVAGVWQGLNERETVSSQKLILNLAQIKRLHFLESNKRKKS